VKIVDAFMHSHERDLLEYRLNLLNEIVDRFVIVQGNRTFTGDLKSMDLSGREKFLWKFRHKIIFVNALDFPHPYPLKDIRTWENETYQRNAISTGINKAFSVPIYRSIKRKIPKGFIIISDVDEIPNPDVLVKFKNGEFLQTKIYSLNQYFFYYNLRAQKKMDWNQAKVLSLQLFYESKLTPQEIRTTEGELVPSGGWHLSYFMSPTSIGEKIGAFSHVEYDKDNFTNLNAIKNRVENRIDLFDRGSEEDLVFPKTNSLPPVLGDILNKYL
jgi:beta-1,4-mannosyl-glycoprotein beta-1,4-N-acetylglucosaminyltransferase